MRDFRTEIARLTGEQQQVLKDCVNFGYWGGCDFEFQNEDGTFTVYPCSGYITNEAKKGGHFSGRKVSGLFRGIYARLRGAGEILTHASNWWEDGSGDALFIHGDYVDDFEKWAKE